MKYKLSITLIITLLTMAGTVFLVAAQSEKPNGTIRGGVYLDTDGDGQCTAATPISHVDILFEHGNNHVTLYSGSNGTYGLPAASRGDWLVTAQPDASKWRVTSTNPLHVTVSGGDGLVQLNNNFCVAPVSGSTAVSSSQTNNLPSTSTNITTNLPESTGTSQSGTMDTFVENHTVSEALLTTPSETVENVAELPTVEAPVDTAWLTYLNHFRSMAGLSLFQEMESLSEGSRKHARYMVMNDKPVAHSEDRANPLFSPEGLQAAVNGNIFATSQIQADYVWSMNFWTSAPFHLLPIINPDVESVGYGRYNQPVGQFQMAAVLDARTELGNATTSVQYPILFPADGAETWIVRRSLYEWPNPLGNCPGYSVPTGPAIVLQLGDGSTTPSVTKHAFYQGNKLLDSCIFDETNYQNADSYAQKTGRTILDQQDAVVLIPRSQIPINETFTVQIEANGQMYSWSFSTRKGPPE